MRAPIVRLLATIVLLATVRRAARRISSAEREDREHVAGEDEVAAVERGRRLVRLGLGLGLGVS